MKRYHDLDADSDQTSNGPLPKRFESDFRDLSLRRPVPALLPDNSSDDGFMRGVEGKSVAVVDADDLLDLDNAVGIEINKDYLRIPQQIFEASSATRAPASMPTQALVVYRGDPNDQIQDSRDENDEDQGPQAFDDSQMQLE